MFLLPRFPLILLFSLKIQHHTISLFTEAEEKAKLQSYTVLRKQREDFRKRLVDLIMRKEEDMEICPDDIPSAEEREILRYYYYIRHGVDTIHVAPLDQKTLDKVLDLIPSKLKKWNDTLVQSVEDMKDDFMIAVKKAIVDFVLKDPTVEQKLSDESGTVERKEVRMMTGQLMPQFRLFKTKLEKILHVVNPCLAAIIDLWYSNFRDMRIIDVKSLMEHKGAYELPEYQMTFLNHIDNAKRILMNEYYKGVQDIFLAGNKKNKLPNPSLPRKWKRFYNAVATIMTYHLQTLCLNSLYDYTNYVTDVKVRHICFTIISFPFSS